MTTQTTPPAPSGYQTRLLPILIPNEEELYIYSLRDRQQYSDPDKEAAKLGISSALWPLSGLLWPSSFYLAKNLAKHPYKKGSRILEIGCGLALPSLLCHRKGWDITASDHHPLVYKLLKKNLAVNHLSSSLPYRHGDWYAKPLKTPFVNKVGVLDGKYDFIFGSDLLYERDAAPALAAFINNHAQPECEVWLVDANRGGRPAFKRSIIRYGFKLSDDICLNRQPCLSGQPSYKGRLLKYQRLI